MKENIYGGHQWRMVVSLFSLWSCTSVLSMRVCWLLHLWWGISSTWMSPMYMNYTLTLAPSASTHSNIWLVSQRSAGSEWQRGETTVIKLNHFHTIYLIVLLMPPSSHSIVVYPPLYTAIAIQMTDESVSKNDRGGRDNACYSYDYSCLKYSYSC